MHEGKEAFGTRLLNLLPNISQITESWQDLSPSEKANLHSNVKYATDIIGNYAPLSTHKQVTVCSGTPFMQAQGCSSYCGLCH